MTTLTDTAAFAPWYDKVWYPCATPRNAKSPDPLQRPTYWSAPRVVSVATDLFAADVTDAQRDRCFAVMALRHQHTFVLLTDHAVAMQRYLDRFSWDRVIRNCNDKHGGSLIHHYTGQALMMQLGPQESPFASMPKRNAWPLPNLWLGVRVGNRGNARSALLRLSKVPAAHRWVHVQPTEGVKLGAHRDVIDWVVCSGQQGAHASPMHPEWPQALLDECNTAQIPFRFEGWGEWCPRGPESCGYVSVENVPRRRITNAGENGQRLGARGGNDVWMNRAGRRLTGRALNAHTYDQTPFSQTNPSHGSQSL